MLIYSTMNKLNSIRSTIEFNCTESQKYSNILAFNFANNASTLHHTTVVDDFFAST